ncbi:MAG TPA: UbiA family prenyltransferase, partial [Rhizobiaceae bacterium]|nr:UbiA family prenyltransferase [Rhizobiaceae bacterium]
RDEVLQFIDAQRKAGRIVVLATATDEKIARAIAGHLGCFDDVIASGNGKNLKSKAKLDELIARYGDGGFDYMGNSAHDLVLFDAARQAIVVAPDRAAERWRKAHDAPLMAKPKRPFWKSLVKMLRVHQWSKNALIGVAPLLDHRLFEGPILLQAAGAFIAFSFTASAVYVLNDLFDLSADREHKTKRNRPLAAGDIAPDLGLKIAFGLLAAAAAVCLFMPFLFTLVLGAYFIATTAYSLKLKRYLLIDVLTLAGLYTVRVIAGAAATTVPLSFWLIAFSLFFFLSLALVKRYVELDQCDAPEKQRLKGRGYRVEDKEIIAQAGVASGFASALVLALYMDSYVVRELYSQPWMIWPLCPLILYIVLRIWILAKRAEFNDDPVVFIMTDWRSQIMIGFGAVMLLGAGLG